MVRFSAAVKDVPVLQTTQHGSEANPEIYWARIVGGRDSSTRG